MVFPMLKDEIRQAFFRHNQFFFVPKKDSDYWSLFQRWLEIQGSTSTCGMRHLQI